MNHQYRQDALNLMQRLCAYVSSLQAASSGIAQTTDYTVQRSTIEQVFRMTSGANYNQQSIVQRLIVVDSLYATNAKYSYYALDRMAEAISQLGTEQAAEEYFYAIACGGKDSKKLFCARYGIRKNLKEGSRQLSLMSKYAYYTLLQNKVVYPYGFPIYDSLAVEMYPAVCKHLCLPVQKISDASIEPYVAALTQVRKAFFGVAPTLVGGLQQFDILDTYLWRMGKLGKGNYSQILGQQDYTTLTQNLGLKEEASEGFNDKVLLRSRTQSTSSVVAGITCATSMGQMIDHWKQYF